MTVLAVFKQDFFGLRKFLSGLVYIEAVSSTAYACGLYSENKIIVTQTKRSDSYNGIRPNFYAAQKF